MITVREEVCPACLGPATGGDPQCTTCGPEGGDYRTIMLRAECVKLTYSPSRPGTWSYDGGDPPEGEDFGGIDRYVREDTGAQVDWHDVPDPTADLLYAAMIEAQREAFYDREDCRADDERDAEMDR